MARKHVCQFAQTLVDGRVWTLCGFSIFFLLFRLSSLTAFLGNAATAAQYKHENMMFYGLLLFMAYKSHAECQGLLLSFRPVDGSPL